MAREGEYLPKKADIFSLGVTILFILTGKMPWKVASETDKYFKNLSTARKPR